MDVSTPPSLDLACPQAKIEIEKHVHMLWERGVDKNKIRTYQHHVDYYNKNKIKHKTFTIELLSYTSHE
mgnify:CR=1 FL=1